MSDQPQGQLQTSTGGGVSGIHASAGDFQFLVAPATADEFNRTRLRLIPVACWRVDDIRFRFDSSLVLPGIAKEMQALAKLVKDHPGAPLSVFGHADPVGNDDYNKQLSGRRSAAIYAMLIRDASMWDDLFSHPLGRDNWGNDGLKTMHNFVAPQDSSAPVPGQRKQLFLDYMDAVCGKDFKLQKTDFLGRGADAKGKADFQGCGEFNPLLIFSKETNDRLESDPDKTARNAANGPNRRVLILLFRKDSRVDPSKWPCPRATEGGAGCVKRFFSDGEQRRSRRLPQDDRKFEETKDTFACRFYQRLLSLSPCEALSQLPILAARFVGPGNERTTKTELQVCDGGGTVQLTIPASKADETADGYAIYQFDPRVFPNPVILKWQTEDGEEHLAGPCDPVQLRNLLAKSDLVTAEPLVEPAAPVTTTASADAGSASDEEDVMPRENEWQTLKDAIPTSLA